MNYLSNQDWTFPTSIRYGPERIKELTEICNQKGIKKPMIVTDKGSKNLNFIDDILVDLKKKRYRSKNFCKYIP